MVNKVILIGNVGLDPEVRTTEGGVKVARVRLATTERLFDRASNETKEHTEWHTITLWRGLADVVDRFVRKGSQIYIEGRLQTRKWQGQDGQDRYSTEIVANEMDGQGQQQTLYDRNSGRYDEPLGASLGQSRFGRRSGSLLRRTAAGGFLWPAGRLSAADTPSGSGSAAPAGSSFSPGRRSGRPAFLIFDL